MAGMESRLEEYMSLAEKAYGQAFEEAQDLSGWEVVRSAAEFVACKKVMSGGYAAIKIDAYIPKGTKAVLDLFYDHFGEHCAELLPDLFESEIYPIRYNDRTKLCYSRIKSPVLGISPRDSLYFSLLLDVGEDSFALIDTSVEAAEYAPVAGYVRSILKYSLHVFEPMEDDPGKTHLLVVALADAQGSIPTGLVNATLGKRADFYQQLIARLSA